MRAISAAESANDTAFSTYPGSGPHSATKIPARGGVNIQARFSDAWSSEFACGRSSSVTRFGMPA